MTIPLEIHSTKIILAGPNDVGKASLANMIIQGDLHRENTLHSRLHLANTPPSPHTGFPLHSNGSSAAVSSNPVADIVDSPTFAVLWTVGLEDNRWDSLVNRPPFHSDGGSQHNLFQSTELFPIPSSPPTSSSSGRTRHSRGGGGGGEETEAFLREQLTTFQHLNNDPIHHVAYVLRKPPGQEPLDVELHRRLFDRFCKVFSGLEQRYVLMVTHCREKDYWIQEQKDKGVFAEVFGKARRGFEGTRRGGEGSSQGVSVVQQSIEGDVEGQDDGLRLEEHDILLRIVGCDLRFDMTDPSRYKGDREENLSKLLAKLKSFDENRVSVTKTGHSPRVRPVQSKPSLRVRGRLENPRTHTPTPTMEAGLYVVDGTQGTGGGSTHEGEREVATKEEESKEVDCCWGLWDSIRCVFCCGCCAEEEKVVETGQTSK